MFRRDELEAIAKLAIQYDAFVVTDEVYEHIIYAPAEHICMASLPGMFEHTITCNSLSKTYSITGWRLGYLIGPAEVIEGARKVHDFLTVGAAAPLQEAAVAGLEMPASYYEELQALYTEKRDHFLAGLDRVGLKHNVPQGTYFVMIDISDFLALPQFKGWTDLQFCEWMIREVGVAAVPGSSFFREPVNHLIRMHFCPRHRCAERSRPPAGKAAGFTEIKSKTKTPLQLKWKSCEGVFACTATAHDGRLLLSVFGGRVRLHGFQCSAQLPRLKRAGAVRGRALQLFQQGNGSEAVQAAAV